MATTNLKIGDSVTVPGQMYGTLKFVGPVNGKRGIFAGVQLAPEFAVRGKNSGDVEGRHYFRTSVPGSGIFLPIDKAEKRMSGGSATSTPGNLPNFSQGGRIPSTAMSKPNFSQSVGPGSLAARTASPTALKPPGRRESLPRPSSPLRKVNNAPTALTPAAGRLGTPKTRPSLGFNKSAMGAPGTAGAAMKSPAVRQPSRFGQSLRQSVRAQGSITPSRVRPPPSSSASVATSTTEEYPLGPESAFDESPPAGSADDSMDHTPTPAASRPFRPKVDVKRYEEEIKLLREQLDDRDRQINDQSSSIAEMDRSLQDLQHLIQNMDSAQTSHNQQMSEDEESLPRDIQELRSTLREKNDRIKAMTAEFDNNRADFRSTIDTLEMASSETERVYESRIEELVEEIKHLQERSEDVEGVAQQFRQLEEFVVELEEGLEDARRGEAEARGEVEFLRGEVERGRSELRKERDRSRTGDKLNGIDADGGGVSSDEVDELHVRIDQKDDEIRGLKAIIQNMNNADISPTRTSRNSKMNGGPFSHGHAKTKSTNTVISVGTNGEDTATHLQNQIHDLETLLEQKSTREEELKEEVTKLRQSVQFGPKFVVPGLEGKHQRVPSNLSRHQSLQSAQSASTITATRSSGSSFHRGKSKKSNDSEFTDAEQFYDFNENAVNEGENHILGTHTSSPRTPDAVSVSAGTETSSTAMYCEICEEAGHDILTCGQMIGSTSPAKPSKPPQRDSARTLTSKDSVHDSFRRSNENLGPPPETNAPPPPPLTAAAPTRAPTQPVASNKRSSLEDVARPAPLSMSRQASAQFSTRSPMTSPRKTTHFSIPEVKPSTPTTTTDSPAASANTNANGAGPKSGGLIEGTGDQAGMLAGKESGIIDPDKWCALCERDGHESVDCPIESAF